MNLISRLQQATCADRLCASCDKRIGEMDVIVGSHLCVRCDYGFRASLIAHEKGNGNAS
jgi:hypothetical protein